MTSRFLVGAVAAAVAAAAVITTVQAQFFDDRFPFQQRGWGGGSFAPFGAPQQPQRPVDNSHAPAPRKHEKNETDLSTVLVFGDSMSDWLAFGLETAFADSPELTVMRKHRTSSSLIVNPNSRSRSFDWVANARDVLAKENPQFIVMMIGLNDRETIREPRQPAATPGQPGAQQRGAQRGRAGAQTQQAPAATPAPAEQPKPEADAKPPVDGAPNDDQATDDAIVAPEPQRAGSGTHEFKSERWVELYTKRIDEMLAVLKSKGVPVFWVGLPPIRGTRSTSDVLFLNDLYKARAEKAGVTYIDVWDGFVDEAGRFAQHGPDFEGQTRRLRSGDGVHFSQAGARKLAHYVEKEIRRAMTPQGPIAIPLPSDPAAEPGKAATVAPDNTMPRPLAGPVLPLNAAIDVCVAGELAGASGPRQSLTDVLASKVLIQGELQPAPAGRADDFAWPRRAPAPLDADPVVAKTTLPMTPMIAERPGATKSAAAEPPPTTVRRRTAQAPQQRREAGRPPQNSFFFFFQRPN